MRLMSRSERLLAHVRRLGLIALQLAVFSGASLLSSPASAQETNPPEETLTAPFDAADATSTGAFATRLPIKVPKARGPIPTLSITYNSQQGNGIAGMGWSIAGLPAVTRGRLNDGLRYDGLDGFFFVPGGWASTPAPEGQLIPVNKVTPTRTRYHTVSLSAGSAFNEFEPVGTCGSATSNVPCYWLMRDGSGTTYYFGGDETNNAGMYTPAIGFHAVMWEPDNGATQHRGILSWSLYKVVQTHNGITDSTDNYYKVTYENGSLLPDSIDYNLPAAGATPKSMRVTFEYSATARADITPMPQRFTQLLKNIRVFSNCPASGSCSLVRRYQLDHTTSSISGNSLLTAFKEFGSDGDIGGTHLPALTFTYTSLGGGGAAPQTTETVGAFLTFPGCSPTADPAHCRWTTLVGDINGDGRADVVRSYHGNQGDKVEYMLGGVPVGTAFGRDKTTHTNSPATTYTAPYFSTLADVNGDGKADLVRIDVHHSGMQNSIGYAVALGREPAAGDTNQSRLGDLYWQQPDSLSATGASVSYDWDNWRIVPADVNGDGYTDIALYDDSTRTLIVKISRGTGFTSGGQGNGQGFQYLTQQGVNAAVKRASNAWTLCAVGQGSFPPSHTFNGFFAADLNGDGRQDLIASWSGKEAPTGENERGKITIMTAMGGGGAVIGTPTEYCEIHHVGQNAEVRWPYLAMRTGDINGDGRQDVLLNYQGRASMWNLGYRGVVNGRDLRNWLGTNGTVSTINVLHNHGRDQYTYPYASLSEGHLNQWEFHSRDINGDGIDDFIEFYAGQHGLTMNWGLGTPRGMDVTHSPAFTINGHPTNTSTPWEDGASYTTYRKWTSTMADVQGDGKADLVRVRMGGSTSPSVQYIFGTTAGLSSTATATSNLAGAFSGDSRYMVVRAADVNGDGRDDILIINNNGEQPSSAKIHVAESPAPTSNAGVPDLLETIDNSMLGRTTVTYKHASAMAAAIQPRSASCGGASYRTPATGAACGRPNARPRALVYEINRNNGWGFSNRYRYNYVNGRVFGGNPLFRRDLGFQEIWKTDLNTNAYDVTHYRQEQPFQRRPSHVARFRGDYTALSSDTYTYTLWDPYSDQYNSNNSGLKAIGYNTKRHVEYESSSPGSAYAISDHTYTYVWDWRLNLTELRDSTTESGDTHIVTKYSYSNDEPNWLLGKELSMWKYRGSNILDMTRTTYGDAARPLLATKHERVLFHDSAVSTCASGVIEPWAGACAAETSTGTAAKWVTLFQNPAYDSYGNLTYGEAVPVMAFDNTTANHRKILGYDPNYMGLIASVTLATGDTASTTFDFAGRPLTTTDANNQPHTWTYDVYGRPTARREPGTSATSVRTWRYDGLTTFGYLFHDDNHASSSQTHRSDNYLDGFGALRQTTDYSGAGTITTLIQSAHAGNKLIRRRSLPTFSITPTAYLESAFDAKGRPEYVQRVNASFVQQKCFITYTYHTDGSISKTDAAGRTARTYLNQRGQTTRIADALGNNTYYYYNIALAPRQIVLPTGQTGNAVNVTYDSWGRLRTMDDPAAGFSTHEYNDAGSLLSVQRYTSAAKTTLTSQLSYGYDALERIATEGDPTVRASYYYAEAGRTNARGRLTRVVDLSGSTLLDYDVRGNVSRKEITLNGYTSSQVLTFTYNDRNMMTRKTFPGGSSDQYYYYTADGLLTSLVDSTSAVTYASYSQFTAQKQIGRLQSYYANSAYANTTTFGYDVDGQLTSKVLTRRDGTVLSDEAYTYDAVGNLLRTDDRRSGSKMVGPVNTDASQDYAYDALNRLTFTCNNVVSGTCVGFGYDALGNMTSDSGESIAYYTTGSGAAQEKCVKSMTGATTNWIACHDTEGKRKRFEDYQSYLPSSASFSYTYDYKQRLTKVTKDGIDKEIYEYNYAGERTRKTYLDSTTNSWIRTWFVDPSFEIRNSDGSPTLFSKTFHEGSAAVRTYAPTITNQATTATVNASQYQRMSGSPIWANAQGNYVKHLDRLGSTYLMSKIPGSASDPSDGSELARYWTDPWGIVRKVNSVGYDMTARKFGDRQYEDYSRLMYFGARYYHPLTRRFLTADDRIIRGATDAQGFHRFTYALNNPMRFVDPLGHDPKKPSWAASEPYGPEMPSSPSDERAAAAAAYASQFPAPPPQGPSLGPLDGQVMNTDHIAKVVSTLSDIADQGLRNFIHDKLKSEAAPVSVPRPGEAQGGNAASWNYGFQSTIVQSPGGFDPNQTGRGGIIGQRTLSDGTVIAGPYLPGEEMLKLTLRPASETLDPDRIMKEKQESEGKGSAPEFHDVHLAQWVMMDIATADSFQGAIANIANDIQMNPVGTIIPSVPGSGGDEGGGAIPCPFYCGY